MSSSFTQPHNYYNSPPSRDWQLTTADLVTLSFAFTIVFLRCYTKFFLIKTPGWDDCQASNSQLRDFNADRHIDTCIIALVVAIARTAVDFVGRCQFGSGRHIWDIPPEYFDGLVAVCNLSYVYMKMVLTFGRP